MRRCEQTAYARVCVHGGVVVWEKQRRRRRLCSKHFPERPKLSWLLYIVSWELFAVSANVHWCKFSRSAARMKFALLCATRSWSGCTLQVIQCKWVCSRDVGCSTNFVLYTFWIDSTQYLLDLIRCLFLNKVFRYYQIREGCIPDYILHYVSRHSTPDHWSHTKIFVVRNENTKEYYAGHRRQFHWTLNVDLFLEHEVQPNRRPIISSGLHNNSIQYMHVRVPTGYPTSERAIQT